MALPFAPHLASLLDWIHLLPATFNLIFFCQTECFSNPALSFVPYSYINLAESSQQ
jgi:hypothetical protein